MSPQVQQGRLTNAFYPTTLAEALELEAAVNLAATHGSDNWSNHFECDESSRAVIDQIIDEHIWPYAYTGHKYSARASIAMKCFVLELSQIAPEMPVQLAKWHQLSLFGDAR